MKIKSAACTHTGMKRRQNQDCYAELPDLGLFVVADGMGGHRGGETASRIAVDTIEEAFRASSEPCETPEAATLRMREAIKKANAAIQAKGAEQPDLRGMGTTASAIFFPSSKNGKFPDLAVLGQVGDSRGYLIQPGRIWQLTRDHSLVQEKLRAGILTRAQLKTAPNRNVITRSVGYEPDVETDLFWVDAKPGDIFLLCSDGLHGLVDDDAIRALAEEFAIRANDLDAAAAALVDAANRNGGHDNVTAVLVQVGK
ncbi:MAG: Stp1/IreP family PP2C-type Ser/Thr phosphatase [Deltaproteobacteria bacterium]|nr:Stp1/IreP family PP2C-type Ser/Thr phosphatase [Deltaproteobacteria bacterium]